MLQIYSKLSWFKKVEYPTLLYGLNLSHYVGILTLHWKLKKKIYWQHETSRDIT
jgi:hypothetical protein